MLLLGIIDINAFLEAFSQNINIISQLFFYELSTKE